MNQWQNMGKVEAKDSLSNKYKEVVGCHDCSKEVICKRRNRKTGTSFQMYTHIDASVGIHMCAYVEKDEIQNYTNFKYDIQKFIFLWKMYFVVF